jgi:hypothetical protein
MHILQQTNNDSTVTEARNMLVSNLSKGVECPCCTQYVKLYRRAFTKSMAIGLKLLYDCQATDEWGYIHLENYLKDQKCASSIRGDMPKARFWGLIEGINEKRDDESKRNGYYRLTKKGEDFIEGLICIPDAVFIFNNEIHSVSEKTTTFKDCNKKFNYLDIC